MLVKWGEVIPSNDYAIIGAQSLRVWANKEKGFKSNHIIGQKRISTSGQHGTWMYSLHFFIEPEGTEHVGETGPEFSMQNTRQIEPGVFRTTTAGIQYIANPASDQFGLLQIWTEQAPGEANWSALSNIEFEPGKWYFVSLEVDYDANKYVSLRIRDENTDLLVEDLTLIKIAEEEKFNEEAFWITLESENQFTGCEQQEIVRDYKVYYDNVTVLNFIGYIRGNWSNLLFLMVKYLSVLVGLI